VESLVARLEAEGKALEDVRREDFDRAPCDRIAAELRRRLVSGAGFALLRRKRTA